MLTHQLFIQSPMTNVLIFLGVGVALSVLLIAYAKVNWFMAPEPGTMILRVGRGGYRILGKREPIIPLLHKAYPIDVKVKEIKFRFVSENAVRMRDNQMAEIEAVFRLKVSTERYDAINVARAFGPESTFDMNFLRTTFGPKFEESIRAVAFRYTFAELHNNKNLFRDDVANTIGTNLNGYHLLEVAVTHIGPQPLPLPKGALEFSL